MTLQIIIRNRDRQIIKGKTVSEFADNMAGIGWPSEFINGEARDRVRFVEKKEGRALTKADAERISREMGIKTPAQHITDEAHKRGLRKNSKP